MDQYLLNQYFQELGVSQSEASIKELTAKIWEIWMQSGEEAIDKQMEAGCEMLCQENYDNAIEVFSQIIEELPDYAEAWNKRATAYYLRGEYKKSVEDVKETLSLESRHFGALSGWATICLIINDKACALKAFEKLYQIYPHKKGLSRKIEMLREVIDRP